MKVLLKKWTTVIKKLPSVRQNFKDVTAAVTAKNESRVMLLQMVQKLRYAR